VLKITIDERPQSVILKLEGKLVGPWVDELARSWDEVVGQTPAKAVQVDLSSVSRIDPEGKELLGRMFDQGADLRATSLMSKYIIEEIVSAKSGSRKNGG